MAGTSHDACGVCQQCVEGRYNLCENYGVMDLHRQYGHNYQGADAEYVVHGVKCIFPLPDAVSFEAGAVIDPASIALHVANRARIQPGDNVGIMGGGAIGLLGGEAAPDPRARAASSSSSRCAARRQKALEMGFEVIDPATAGRRPTALREMTGGLGVDRVIEAAGVPATLKLGAGGAAQGWPHRRGRHPHQGRRDQRSATSCSTSSSWPAAAPRPARCDASCRTWPMVACASTRS